MKRFLISICALLILGGNVVIAQEKTKTKEDKTKMKDKETDLKIKDKDDKYKVKEGDNKTKIKEEDVKKESDMVEVSDTASMSSSPYTADYSSNFVMGNPAYSNVILDMWKDWDDNALDRHDYMADS